MKNIIFIGICLISCLLCASCFDKTYTVSFDSNGGTQIEEQKVKKNKKIKIPDAPQKENYDFICWIEKGKSKGGECYSITKDVTSDIALEAVWGKMGENGKYTFE